MIPDLDLPPGQKYYDQQSGQPGDPIPYALASLIFEFNLDFGNGSGPISIEDVAFVFGTGFDEVVLIPLPPALPLGLAGLAGVVVMRRRAVRAKLAA